MVRSLRTSQSGLAPDLGVCQQGQPEGGSLLHLRRTQDLLTFKHLSFNVLGVP